MTYDKWVDVGPERPPSMSPIAWQVAHQIVVVDYEQGAYPLIEMECNLDAITRGVPDYATIDEVPMHWQRHTLGVYTRLRRLLS